jgi:hypothetical protein
MDKTGRADKKRGFINYEDSYIINPWGNAKRVDYPKNILRDDFK